MKIRVLGNKIELCRYKITWTDENGTYEEFAPIRKEADSIAAMYGGNVEALDTTDDEWIDGIILEPTKTPYDDALKIAQMGEQGYNAWLAEKESKNPEKLLEQLTQTQLALTEVYEMMLASGGV